MITEVSEIAFHFCSLDHHFIVQNLTKPADLEDGLFHLVPTRNICNTTANQSAPVV